MDWRRCYENANIPWDLAEAHPELVRRLDAGSVQPSGGSVLVPGCGTGKDALALARAGFVVTALDAVDLLELQIRPVLAQYGGRFVCTDALAYRQVHDALFEHTFFCAIPRERRADYAEMAAACVRPGGHIYAVVFPIGKEPHGWTRRCCPRIQPRSSRSSKKARGSPPAMRSVSMRWVTSR